MALPRERSRVGALLAAFFVAIFPGNIEQYTKGKKGFGLDEDRARLARLFFQPVLVAVAIWSTRAPRPEQRLTRPARTRAVSVPVRVDTVTVNFALRATCRVGPTRRSSAGR